MVAIRRRRESGNRIYEPSPQDIRWACEQIQATWSPQERAKRYRGPCAPWWLPPSIRLAGLLDTLNEEQADLLS
jgi:hypothetical protein